MAHDVFISYSHVNKQAADAVCATLESKGIRCWIAPRDILPGADWGESIIDAIAGSKTMVLVLSSDSNISRQVKNEVVNAVSHNLIVIPFRIEDIQPSKQLQLHLGSSHWLDAFAPPLQYHVEQLARTIVRLHGAGSGPVQRSSMPEPIEVQPAPLPIAPPVDAMNIEIHALPKLLSLDLGRELKIDLALIPAGTFEMGSPEDEKDRGSDEVQHTVTISQPFYMGIHPVNQEQYKAVARLSRMLASSHSPSRFNDPKYPVEHVTWWNARDFCLALHKKTQVQLPKGMEVQLSSEAQWEYACRAGTKTRTYSGDDDSALDRIAWYSKNSGNQTHPAGQKAPNAFGLYDMLGNVLEWCRDIYAVEYETLPMIDPCNDVQGADCDARGNHRVQRGGAYCFTAPVCRSAYRRRGISDDSYYLGLSGFRVVVGAPPKFLSKLVDGLI